MTSAAKRQTTGVYRHERFAARLAWRGWWGTGNRCQDQTPGRTRLGCDRLLSLELQPPAARSYHGVKLISLPSLSKPGIEMLSHTFLATLHAILTNRADIISYHGMGDALFLPLTKLGRKRTVVYMDGIDWERPKWGKMARLLLKFGAAAAFRWADYIYVDNEASQKQFARIFGREPELSLP